MEKIFKINFRNDFDGTVEKLGIYGWTLQKYLRKFLGKFYIISQKMIYLKKLFEISQNFKNIEKFSIICVMLEFKRNLITLSGIK